MKAEIEQLIAVAIKNLIAAGKLPVEGLPKLTVERTRDIIYGDFACHLALTLSKILRQPPKNIAEMLIAALPNSSLVEKVEIAGPGFINFYLHFDTYLNLIPRIIEQGNNYGQSLVGAGKKVQIEFVSSNPTGPLHVGHGRGAAYGSVIANLLNAIGFKVHREYYVNDAGRQMDILATSIWLRYLELCGENLRFPANGYRGDYVWDIAATLHRTYGEIYRHSNNLIFANLPPDAPEGDKETFIDAVITRAKHLLGEVNYQVIFELGLEVILQDIRSDLEQFGVNYDEWYSERSLTERGLIKKCLQLLDKAGHLYTKDGAVWFRSSAFGDEKDRVIIRENGQPTYFASDIAYHLDKFERGFDQIINIWGSDHHGYIPRVKAAIQALGHNSQQLSVLLVQFAILYRGKERAQMSTRSGEFVTLRTLRQEVGRDAARFFYVMRTCDAHLDFDLDLAKSQSIDNPVYYVQYAHARICSVFHQAQDKGLIINLIPELSTLKLLTTPHEQTLLRTLSRYSEILEIAALQYEPHQLTNYLKTLANDFHTYYNAYQFLVADETLRNARLSLIQATKIILSNGLNLLGISAPETM
jgi:arginyl-tRNA synthetase